MTLGKQSYIIKIIHGFIKLSNTYLKTNRATRSKITSYTNDPRWRDKPGTKKTEKENVKKKTA